MNAKQLVAASWLALIFLVAASIPLSAQQSSSYDPWLDYNGDGQISASDLSSLAQAYGASGESTRNVTVVGHLTKLERVAVNVSLSPHTSWNSNLIWVDGYIKMTILISLIPNQSNKLYVYAYDSTGLSGPSWIIEQISSIPTYWVKTYDVFNQQLRIGLENTSTDYCVLNVEVYLIA